MTEYLDTRRSSEIETPQVPEFEPRPDTPMHLGARSVKLAQLGGTNEMHDTEQRYISPEAKRNGELYVQAYDAAIEAIESAFGADSTQLDERLVMVLDSIDVLSGVPYISSAPEFVDLVKAARHNVEQAHSRILSSETNHEMDPAVANTLSLVKQQLAATTVAYRP